MSDDLRVGPNVPWRRGNDPPFVPPIRDLWWTVAAPPGTYGEVMTAQATLLDRELDSRLVDYARRLGVEDEAIVTLTAHRCHDLVTWGSSPEEALEDGCALLGSWLRHPSNQP